MGFFRKLLGRDRAVQNPITAPPVSPDANGAIGYDAKLIETLHKHHAQLGTLFQRIGNSARQSDSHGLHELLATFKSSLNGHVLTENVRFYSYLEQTISDDADSAAIVREYRREMNDIAREVRQFVDQWRDADISSSETQNQFLAEYHRVGKLLERRLDSEEQQLYPLYRPA